MNGPLAWSSSVSSVYKKNKHHKYGVKLYMLTEPTGLVQKVLIYSGQGTSPEMSHTEYVVNK